MVGKLVSVIPTMPELAKSTLITLGGVLLAAFILSRFPKIRDFVAGQSISVKDGAKTLYF
jgi:hypothetical protein